MLISPTGGGVRVVHFHNVSISLRQRHEVIDYITHNPRRPATSWLPPLWECFAFKQTRSCWRWRSFYRRKINRFTQWNHRSRWVFRHLLITWGFGSFEPMLASVWTLKLVAAVGVAPLPNRLWFLSYRNTMNHLSTACPSWNACHYIMGLQTTHKILVVKCDSIRSRPCRLRCLPIIH